MVHMGTQWAVLAAQNASLEKLKPLHNGNSDGGGDSFALSFALSLK